MTIPTPEPVILRTVMPDDYRYGHVYGFTRRQVEAYAAARVREALPRQPKRGANHQEIDMDGDAS